MQRRTFNLKTHRTSVKLEPEFWAVLERLATSQGLKIHRLVQGIYFETFRAGEQGRHINFASVLRVYCLKTALGETV